MTKLSEDDLYDMTREFFGGVCHHQDCLHETGGPAMDPPHNPWDDVRERLGLPDGMTPWQALSNGHLTTTMFERVMDSINPTWRRTWNPSSRPKGDR